MCMTEVNKNIYRYSECKIASRNKKFRLVFLLFRINAQSSVLAKFYCKLMNYHSASLIQLSTIPFKLGFSSAAATRSLSLICLLTEIVGSIRARET